MWIHSSIHLMRRAAGGVQRRPWLHLASLLTMTAAFLSFSATLTAAANLDNLLSRWVGSGEITVYLNPAATDQDLAGLAKAIGRLEGVARTEPVAPSKARERFSAGLGDMEEIARTLPEVSFPATIDVYLDESSARSHEARQALASRIGQVEMVDEVERYEDWYQRLSAINFVARLASGGLGLLALIVSMVVVGSMVRSGIGSRRSEIEALRFLGATERYIRFPFLMGGAIEAGIAMALALVSLHFLTTYAQDLTGGLLVALGIGNMVRLAPVTVVALVCGSALAGTAGARIFLRSQETV